MESQEDFEQQCDVTLFNSGHYVENKLQGDRGGEQEEELAMTVIPGLFQVLVLQYKQDKVPADFQSTLQFTQKKLLFQEVVGAMKKYRICSDIL